MDNELIDALLAPISADRPCGESIRYSPEFDALVVARQEDDETLPSGVWQTTPRRADWAEVEKLAIKLLQERSKDLHLFCWLGEAWIKQHGIVALPNALKLIALTLEHYPDGLYPEVHNGDYDFRAAPLYWMSAHYARLLANAPLLTGSGGTLSLQAWQQSSTTSVTATTPVNHVAQALAASLEWLERINRVCHHWPETSSPSFRPLEHNIKTCLKALGETASEISVPAAKVTAETFTTASAFSSRNEAYQTLKAVADYLQKTEPHSPVPYLLLRAVEWGNTPLPALLMELINEDDAARRVWRQLGVLP